MRTRSLIGGNGKPNASCSASIQPVPMPRETRPPEISYAVIEAFASTAGGRKVTGETSVPSSIRSRPRRQRGDDRPGVERRAARVGR